MSASRALEGQEQATPEQRRNRLSLPNPPQKGLQKFRGRPAPLRRNGSLSLSDQSRTKRNDRSARCPPLQSA